MDNNLIIIGLLLFVAGQTSYISYRTWRGSVSRRGQPVFIDTSVLMDGRIVPITQAGFVPGRLVIPRSVIGELQFLADNSDSEKRERARRGLDVVQTLQTIEHVRVEILQDGSKAEEGVDERLLFLAKKYHGILSTIDFNLNKVAQVEGIRVLNVNELAQQLRMSYLPGDKLALELTTAGSDSHQAVGHLNDGTMVVVEHAKASIGKKVEVEIIRSLQTAAGRMMFAKLANAKPASTSIATAKSISKPAPAKRKSVSSDSSASGRRPSTTQKSPRSPKQTNRPSRSSQSTPARKTASGSNRRPSSAQREASLVDLIEKQ